MRLKENGDFEEKMLSATAVYYAIGKTIKKQWRKRLPMGEVDMLNDG